MGTLQSLANKLENMAKDLAEKASKRSIRMATNILQELVYTTPVDTSTALSGWQISLKEPPSTTQYTFFYGSKGSTQGVSASAAMAVGIATLEAKQPGETVYISNLTDYIGELNRGSSAQAPAGFVERAVMIGKNSVRNT